MPAQIDRYIAHLNSNPHPPGFRAKQLRAALLAQKLVALFGSHRSVLRCARMRAGAPVRFTVHRSGSLFGFLGLCSLACRFFPLVR